MGVGMWNAINGMGSMGGCMAAPGIGERHTWAPASVRIGVSGRPLYGAPGQVSENPASHWGLWGGGPVGDPKGRGGCAGPRLGLHAYWVRALVIRSL